MNEIKLKALKQDYRGKCKIIPCCDLPKMENDNFDDTRDDIIEVFKEQRLICDWSLKDGVLEKYENLEEDETEEELKETFWNDLVCRCLNEGFLVIYDVPIPKNIKKDNGKFTSWTSYGWGYYQTFYIHLTYISQLNAVLSNLDDRILEDVWKEEQEIK